MKHGYLSQYFEGVAMKRLSAVEADVIHSNQHEFNGVDGLKKILGEPTDKEKYDATFLYLSDDDEPISETGFLTWYDARQKARIERGVNRWEYRLYFPTNLVSQCAAASDLLVIAKLPGKGLLAIVAENGSTISRQIAWLFGFSDDESHPGFSVREELETDQDRIEFASRFILESIGITVETSEGTWLDEMLTRFKGTFPKTRDFSAFARQTLKDMTPKDGHDQVLMAWMEREEILFRTLERHIIAERLSKGFDNDVDGFIAFSLSVQNRRKSRVGLALENHLEVVFSDCGICYSRAAVTENRSKPDFIFPGHAQYHNQDFNPAYLTMLGVKSTCKDRWRQVLAEAARVERKHLLTLEAAISPNQTDEMQSKNLQLVLPKKLHETYMPSQQAWLMDFSEFTQLVLHKQGAI
jgi:hypothetical protein